MFRTPLFPLPRATTLQYSTFTSVSMLDTHMHHRCVAPHPSSPDADTAFLPTAPFPPRWAVVVSSRGATCLLGCFHTCTLCSIECVVTRAQVTAIVVIIRFPLCATVLADIGAPHPHVDPTAFCTRLFLERQRRTMLLWCRPRLLLRDAWQRVSVGRLTISTSDQDSASAKVGP